MRNEMQKDTIFFFFLNDRTKIWRSYIDNVYIQLYIYINIFRYIYIYMHINFMHEYKD